MSTNLSLLYSKFGWYWGLGRFPYALSGPLAQCRHRTVTPGSGLESPESLMEALQSAGTIHIDKPVNINFFSTVIFFGVFTY